ncbi:class I SAM-dependent methyltransferase [Pseudenhygromyxa sp. WMMC2535]|uniref:O-methyltransferase n=1 Tax=Pseudenhygromyxa sp. WMMC2535 TaxID=2712867 RepID=UPI0015520781|nr:class I SAM-dependent methyltransferase [Pseudenhygromyxa sp. WMMC2535]NVB37939.1 class I SAM-dependent methyltransferase [Pseudenhygromyxa sp. WMMC2535]
MSTLSRAPLPALLERLFAENAAPLPEPTGFTREQLQAMVHSKTDYLRLYAAFEAVPLAVSQATARLLYMLARSTRARTIVEFGASFAISTLHLAAALRDGGGGLVITTEFAPAKIARARANLAEANLADLVELRPGDALETLARDLPETIDLVFLDGAKALYRDVLDRVEARLRPGALVIADNADMCPDYASYVRDPGSGYLSLGLPDDVELSMRLGQRE